MKNKKAIRLLQHIDYYLRTHTNESCEEEHTALTLAIKALENPTGDCISREALKEAISSTMEQATKVGIMVDADYLWGLLNYAIDNAPTVEMNALPKIHYDRGFIAGYEKGKAEGILKAETRPQGEWIEYNATGKKQYMCSECGMKEKNPKIARYCYWCGAEMRKGDAK